MDSLIIPLDHTDPIKLLAAFKTQPESYWIERGEKRALQLFHTMAERVPAYKDFLHTHHINPAKIKSIADFSQVPPVDKNNYLRKYPLEQLCWDGELKTKRWTIAATSGSTGESFYFPREKQQDLQYAITAELYLLNNFQINKKSTLYINGFGMGVWIGGIFTYQAIKIVAERGKYPLSIITPGSSKDEIIKAVQNLAEKFDQIIIGGYPPLIKDTIDDGNKRGLDWKKYQIKFIFSAEGFSEDFRNYILDKTGAQDPYLTTLNHYGTVDLGTMACETPLSILIRRLAVTDTQLYKQVFPSRRQLPTLTQYDPELFYFETENERLYCTAASGLPLVRYDLKDQGGVIQLKEMHKKFQNVNQRLSEEIAKQQLEQKVWNLPFVFVYERSDFTVKLSGANIYADEVRRALQKPPLQEVLSGKFNMIIQFDRNQDQFLEINVELKREVEKGKNLEGMVQKAVINELLESNSEYSYLYAHLPHGRLTPHVVFWPYEHPEHFRSEGKQKWVKKI